MRTEDDARYRPVAGDLYLCHPVEEYRKTAFWQVSDVVASTVVVRNLATSGLRRLSCADWAKTEVSNASYAAGSFERWIPAPEPLRDPATNPQVLDRWAYDAPEGPVDIEVLEVRPNKIGFRYGTSYLNWSPAGFADICKHWRLVCRAAGGPA